MKGRSAYQWRLKLPKSLRKRFVANLKSEDGLKQIVYSLSASIMSGFIWKHTPEGSDFWAAIHTHIAYCEHREIKHQLPEFKEGMSFDEYTKLVNDI